MTGRRVTTREAADALGISVEAVRKRIERGQLDHERVDNRVYVYLDEDRTESGPNVEGEGPSALVESLQDQVSYLREQLSAERRANDENRRLLLAALERIPPQLEAPQETREFRETEAKAPEGAQGAEPRSDTGGAQEGERRPWWRRWLGG
jgi:DNA-binding Lrp family transcriptional regulator